MLQIQEKSLLDAMGEVSDSIAALIRFMVALKRFLESHKIGTVRFELNQDFYEGRGYEIVYFALENSIGEDLMYLRFYTNGTADGEDFAKPDGAGIDCTWHEATIKILKMIGVSNHAPLSQKLVEKAIVALGG